MIIVCKVLFFENFEHLRETKDLAATSTAADKEFRRHAQLPELSAPSVPNLHSCCSLSLVSNSHET
jgi:hypothetical protein